MNTWSTQDKRVDISPDICIFKVLKKWKFQHLTGIINGDGYVHNILRKTIHRSIVQYRFSVTYPVLVLLRICQPRVVKYEEYTPVMISCEPVPGTRYATAT